MTAYGRAALAAHESAGVVVRPYLDPVESVGELVDEVMHYSHVEIRAFVVSSHRCPRGLAHPEDRRHPRRGRGPSRPEVAAVAVSITAADLADRDPPIRGGRRPAAEAVATEIVERYAPAAPEAVQNEADDQHAAATSRSIPPMPAGSPPSEQISSGWAPTHTSALRHSGAMSSAVAVEGSDGPGSSDDLRRCHGRV